MYINISDQVMKYQLSHEIHRYQTHPNPVEHEIIYRKVLHLYGKPAAQFFDEEERLPLFSISTNGRKYPWPVSPDEAQTFGPMLGLTTLALSIAAGVGVARISSLWVGFTVGAIIFLVSDWAAPRILSRIHKPKDLEERIRLADRYTELLEADTAHSADIAHAERLRRMNTYQQTNP